MTTYKEETREYLANTIDSILTIESSRARQSALRGILMVVDDIKYDLQLLLGEAAALEAINNNKNKERQ